SFSFFFTNFSTYLFSYFLTSFFPLFYSAFHSSFHTFFFCFLCPELSFAFSCLFVHNMFESGFIGKKLFGCHAKFFPVMKGFSQCLIVHCYHLQFTVNRSEARRVGYDSGGAAL